MTGLTNQIAVQQIKHSFDHGIDKFDQCTGQLDQVQRKLYQVKTL
jgi:hypothetical protein